MHHWLMAGVCQRISEAPRLWSEMKAYFELVYPCPVVDIDFHYVEHSVPSKQIRDVNII